MILEAIKEVNVLTLVIVASCVLVAIVFIIIELRLGKKKEIKVIVPEYQHQLKNLQRLHKSSNTPQEKLSIINDIAKKFFKEAFNLSPTKDYSELRDEFTKQKKNDYAFFCGSMLNTYYANENPDSSKITLLISTLERLIKKNYQPIEQVKKEPGFFERFFKNSEEKNNHKEIEKIKQREKLIEEFKKKKNIYWNAKDLVNSARKKGYKDSQIKERFLSKGWIEEEIEKILR